MRISLVSLLLCCVVAFAFSQPKFNAQFVVMTNDGAQYSVKIQLNATPATGLGSTTLQFTYNTTDLSFPGIPVAGVDYSYQAFSGGNYVSQVTRPFTNTVSVNISYNGSVGASTTVNTTYTDVVTINFTTNNSSGSSNLQWGLVEIFEDDNLTQCSNDTLRSENTSPLPIQLSSFVVSVTSANQVVLNWVTISEKNNYGFEVQRSLEPMKNFQSISGSFVKGNGTTIQKHSYSYTVSNADAKSWYYRLKQIDLDGTLNYSEAIQAGGKAIPTEFALDQNYPNPFNPTTNISFALPKDGDVTIEVFNILGQRVITLAQGFHEAGYYIVPFDARQLASGIYFYRMVTRETTFLKKMMVLK